MINEFFEKLVFINSESLKEFTMIEQNYFEVDEFMEVLSNLLIGEEKHSG